MALYRFRVSFEDNEDINREIEIKSVQNFEDFHHIILQSIGFDNQHDASFFISDDFWRKGDEIGLRPLDQEEIERRKRYDLPVKKVMAKCKLASMIDDPHQKFVYVYDPKVGWTFLVELVKILLDDPKGTFPKCVKTAGEAPKQYKSAAVVPVADEDDELEEEEPHHDDEAYSDKHDDDETSLLEGEEGDEEQEEEAEEDHSSDEEHPEGYEED
ncbi:MAG: IS1096 element passenger TnpR family protein [Bacteroidia bacterium]